MVSIPLIIRLSRGVSHRVLWETMRGVPGVYPFDSEAWKNQYRINAASVAQPSTDIHRKLQQLEDFAGMNNSQLLEVANKGFKNCDQEAQEVTNRRRKHRVPLLTATLGNFGLEQCTAAPSWKREAGKRPPLHCDQCVSWKKRKKGHWRDEGPRRRETSIRRKNIRHQPEPVIKNLSAGPRNNQTRSWP